MSRSNTVRVLAAVLALSASMLGAQEVPPIYLNFALPGYLSLYPEADYGHPAVILQLDRPVLLNGAYFSGSGGSTLDTHPSITAAWARRAGRAPRAVRHRRTVSVSTDSSRSAMPWPPGSVRWWISASTAAPPS
jgi:hypothetical protein